MSERAIAETPNDEKNPETEAHEVLAPVEVVKKLQPIPIGRLSLQVEANDAFRVNVPQGTLPEQMMDESVWAHISVRLKPGDEIIVMPDDMAWKLRLHVQAAGRNYAHVLTESFTEFAPFEPSEKLPPIYKLEYAGTTLKWRVLREGRELRTGFESEGLARRYAANHEAAVDR